MLKQRFQFSVVLAKNPAVGRAIDTTAARARTPVRYPGSVVNPDTGELISDAEMAAMSHTALVSGKQPVTACPVVRRVRAKNHDTTGELFSAYRF